MGDSADDKVAVEHKLLPSFAVDALEKSTSHASSKKATVVKHQAESAVPKKVTYHASAEEDFTDEAPETEADTEITTAELQQIKRIPHKLPEGKSLKEVKHLLPEGQDYHDTAFGNLPDPAFGDKADSVFTESAVTAMAKYKDMSASEIVKMADNSLKKKKESD